MSNKTVLELLFNFFCFFSSGLSIISGVRGFGKYKKKKFVSYFHHINKNIKQNNII